MLKETETEEKIGFFDTFLTLVAFQLGNGFPWLRLCPRPSYLRWLGTFTLNFRKTPLPHQIFGYAPECNHAFVPLISTPPEFSLMPRFKSINIDQNKPMIKLFLQKLNFSSPGSSAPRPQMASGRLGLTPETAPLPIADL